MARRRTPEARARKRERYAANVAAREGDTDTVPAVKVQSRHPVKITGPYDANHLRPTRENPDPGLLAQAWQPWRHLLPVIGSERRRELPAVVRFHPAYVARRPYWMTAAA